jgi:hypothetical protein
MTELGIELGLILKNPLIIRRSQRIRRLRTNRQHPTPQKGLVKAQKVEAFPISLSFLPSANLDLNENQGRINKTIDNGSATMDTGRMLIPLSAAAMKKLITCHSLFGPDLVCSGITNECIRLIGDRFGYNSEKQFNNAFFLERHCNEGRWQQ